MPQYFPTSTTSTTTSTSATGNLAAAYLFGAL
jgi:hypothetical protein